MIGFENLVLKIKDLISLADLITKRMKLYSLIVLAIVLASCQPADLVMDYSEYPVYHGTDLGLQLSSSATNFKIWAPSADEARLHLYETDLGGEAIRTLDLKKGENGTWSLEIPENLKGQYYTFQVSVEGQWLDEVPDPYVYAVGTNGQRGHIIDLEDTNPEGWNSDQRPPLNGFEDIIIYELHVRDVSMHPNSGISQKGKFLGLTESATKNAEGEKTGLDHIRELGVTHVHLLPSFDYRSIDESKLEENKFNWGYDPQHYNVPEGSYSTNPADGAVRIREFKQMVKSFHDAGIRVILDVVYNHTGATENSNFNQLVPGYYYRQDSLGGFSNASACGNETASERAMMRKFIVESVAFWAEEYHIDGFRFDLMGIHDIETMNAVSEKLRQIDPSIFVYGEGWTAGDSPLPDNKKALKKNTHLLDGVAAFTDDYRDALKGHVFTFDQKGFVSGESGLKESIKFGIVASTEHPQVNYNEVNYSDAPWAKSPLQTITYVSCHDNHTLWDRLMISAGEFSDSERKNMHKLALAMLLTSQGVSFLHAGVEMCRTKEGEENSFESPDSINRIDWSWKNKHKDVFEYTKALIQLRKQHPAFRMTSTEMIQQHLEFVETTDSNLLIYRLKDHANGDDWKEIFLAFNGNTSSRNIDLPKGDWRIAVTDQLVDLEGKTGLESSTYEVPASSALVLFSR